jgi:hypothetical protein
MEHSLQNHKSNPEVMLEAFALAANLAFAQPKNPFGFDGWAHLRNQVSPPAVDHCLDV